MKYLLMILAVGLMCLTSCKDDLPATKTIDGIEYTVIRTDEISGQAVVEGINGTCPPGYTAVCGSDTGCCCAPPFDDRDEE